MSSYELLELLEHLPDSSAFKHALRGGEYSEGELTLRHLANEVARLRATMHAVHGQKYDPPILLSVAERELESEAEQAAEERREGFFSFADRDTPRFTGPDPDQVDWDAA